METRRFSYNVKTLKKRKSALFALLLAGLFLLASAAADTQVYITRTGRCYHEKGCNGLRRSCIPIKLGEAVSKGYRPCSNCNPPILDVANQEQQATEEGELFAVELVCVTDGDTIRVMLEGEETPVRLIGIDTPEKWIRGKNGGFKLDPQPFALEASAFTERILKDRNIWLEYDVDRHDRFDRVLAYVWAQGPDDHERLLVNAQIIRHGLALLLTIPPNVKYIDRLKSALEAAKRDKINLWSE